VIAAPGASRIIGMHEVQALARSGRSEQNHRVLDAAVAVDPADLTEPVPYVQLSRVWQGGAQVGCPAQQRFSASDVSDVVVAGQAGQLPRVCLSRVGVTANLGHDNEGKTADRQRYDDG